VAVVAGWALARVLGRVAAVVTVLAEWGAAAVGCKRGLMQIAGGDTEVVVRAAANAWREVGAVGSVLARVAGGVVEVVTVLAEWGAEVAGRT
jgi:hypothetical protein